jgi:hypothetical protein
VSREGGRVRQSWGGRGRSKRTFVDLTDCFIYKVICGGFIRGDMSRIDMIDMWMVP